MVIVDGAALNAYNWVPGDIFRFKRFALISCQ